MYHADEDRLRPRNLIPFVVPFARGAQHVFSNAGAKHWISESRNEFRIAAIMGPRRNKGREIVVPGGVGIGIGTDVGARRARCIDLRHHLRHSAPVVLARGLQVPDLDRRTGLAANPHSLLERCHDAVALAAHMGSVDSAELRSLPR